MTMFTQSPLLLHLQQWLVEFEFANPWLHPWWALEDATLLGTWFTQDYLSPSPIFRVCVYIAQRGFIIYAFILIRRSYLGYIALGQGRQPSNVIGWLRNMFWEFLIVRIFRIDVFSRPYVNPSMATQTAALSLPERDWPRPKIVGIGPLAQQNDTNPEAMRFATTVFLHHTQANPGLWRPGYHPQTSPPTISRRLPVGTPAHWRMNSMREWGDLAAEARPDGSMTVFLHPQDAAEVIRKGWGQRNPLAVMHEVWLYRFIYHYIFGITTPLHHGAVIIYAPLTPEEMFIVYNDILGAALWWKENFPVAPSI